MAISVHTNASALTALQNLNNTNDELTQVQNRVNTGLKIANAKDNAAIWSIAQGQRADIGALGAVRMSLDRAKSIAEVSMAAGESVSDLLVQMKEKVVAAQDPSLDTAARNAIYTQIDKKTMDDAVLVPLTYFKVLLARPKATNLVSTAAFSGEYDYLNIGVESK